MQVQGGAEPGVVVLLADENQRLRVDQSLNLIEVSAVVAGIHVARHQLGGLVELRMLVLERGHPFAGVRGPQAESLVRIPGAGENGTARHLCCYRGGDPSASDHDHLGDHGLVGGHHGIEQGAGPGTYNVEEIHF